MQWVDVAGFIASSLVFLTFYMKDMVPLRLAALCSNFAFLVYGICLHLAPIVLLHTALIPINLYRLLGAANRDRWFAHTRANAEMHLAVLEAPPRSGQAATQDYGVSSCRDYMEFMPAGQKGILRRPDFFI